MALKHHLDDKVRFDQQVDNSEAYVLPFIEKTKAITAGTRVFEVGAAEGGVLLPFMQRGCECLGVDLAPTRIERAKELLADAAPDKAVKLVVKNIYDTDFIAQYKGYFDVVILKDVIEHVPEQANFIRHLKTFLRPGGQIFFGFPPWYMPFGGHQQVCHNKWASKLPWYHILPGPVYRSLLKMAKESDGTITELMEIKDTGITIERFERIVKQAGLRILAKQHYLINPIYKYKFGLQPRKQYGVLSAIPFFRNFVTTCVYYTVGE